MLYRAVVLNRGESINFQGGARRYASCNVESLINKVTNNTFVFTTYWKSGELKQRTITQGKRGRKKVKNRALQRQVRGLSTVKTSPDRTAWNKYANTNEHESNKRNTFFQLRRHEEARMLLTDPFSIVSSSVNLLPLAAVFLSSSFLISSPLALLTVPLLLMLRLMQGNRNQCNPMHESAWHARVRQCETTVQKLRKAWLDFLTLHSEKHC